MPLDLNCQLESRLKRLKESDISARNKELILKFHDNCFAEGLTVRRTLVYASYLPRLAAILGKDFDKATKEDLQHLVAQIERSDYAERSKYDLKVVIKKFYKWLLGNNEFYPPEVRWIKMKMNGRKMLPEELLTQEDVKKLIGSAEHIRDKAFVSVLFEGGFRIGELLPMKLKHIDFNGDVVKMTVPGVGKTGVRKVLLVNSLPYLSNWVAHHPRRDDPEYPLWICTGSYNHNRQMSYNTARDMLATLAEKAGIRKKVNPHAFRHARATILAAKLTESQLKNYLGWTQASKMAGVYVHLSGRETDDAILQMHGLKTEEETRPDKGLQPRKCPRCEKVNEPDARLCCRCGMALDVETALDLKEKSDLIAQVMPQEMINQLVELVIERLRAEKPAAA
jgi:integrase